jgi:hypothetical protein
VCIYLSKYYQEIPGMVGYPLRGVEPQDLREGHPRVPYPRVETPNQWVTIYGEIHQ